MRVKLGDVCERGTSNLKLLDVSEKNGEFSVFGASGYIGSVDFYQQGYPYVAVVKDGAGIGRAMLCPGKTSVIPHEALVFTAAVPVCCRIFEDLVFRADHTVIELVVDVSPPLMSALHRLRPLVRCG